MPGHSSIVAHINNASFLTGKQPGIFGAKRTDDGPLFTFDQLTGVRSSEAAFYDPRTGEFAAQVGDSLRTLVSGDDAAAIYADVQTATITADVDGTADEIEDANAGSVLFVRGVTPTRVYQGVQYAFSFKAKQDADTSRFPMALIGIDGVAGNARLCWNTSTGDLVTSTPGSYTFDAATVTDDGEGCWDIFLQITAHASGANAVMAIYPAWNTVLDAATTDAAATGSIIIKETLVTDNDAGWKRANQLRIFSDGAALFEEARTNYVQESWDLDSWSGGGGASVTAVPVAAPDGGVAYSVEDDSGVGLEYLLLNVTAPPVGTITVSAFFERNSTGWPGIQVRDDGAGSITGGTAAVHVDTTNGLASAQSGSPTDILVEEAGPDWYRLSFKLDVTVSGSFPVRLYGAFGTVLGTASASATGDCMIRDVKIEAGEWSTSPIRTSGAAATRTAESGVLPSASVPATMLSGAWSYTWQPPYSSTEHVAAALSLTHFTFAGALDPANGIQVLSSATFRLRISSTVEVAQAITWNALDEITFTVDLAAGEVTIAGALTGNGTYAMASGSGLSWGAGDVTVSPLNGVRGILYPPQAA